MADMFGAVGTETSAESNRAFKQSLNKVYSWYLGGFLVFLVALAILEAFGLPRLWIGYTFLLATIGLYAGIGIMSRTTDAAESALTAARALAVFDFTSSSRVPTSIMTISAFLERPGPGYCSDR